MELSSSTFERTRPEIDYDRKYEELLGFAKAMAGELGVPHEWYSATMGILEDMGTRKPHLPWIRCESVQVVQPALAIARIKEEFWGTQINKPAVWCAAMLHDNGKTDIPDEVNIVSHEGMDWPDPYREIMKLHPDYGAQRARAYGLPMVVWRPIEESHGKQLAPCYGHCPELSPEELPIRNCVGIADAVDAMFDRENTLNKHMPFEERVAYCEAYIRHACNDYENGSWELAELIIQQIVPR